MLHILHVTYMHVTTINEKRGHELEKNSRNESKIYMEIKKAENRDYNSNERELVMKELSNREKTSQ